MEIFYSKQLVISTECVLDENESSHLVNSLRKRNGDDIQLTDGNGKLYEAIIVQNHAKKCVVKVTKLVKEVKSEFPYELHLAIALTKNMDRFEYFVEKAVEIGITTITPLLCEKSERKILNNARIDKIALSAMKQSGSLFLPEICDLTTFNDFILTNSKSVKLICVCSGERELLEHSILRNERNIVMVGPEGDFSLNEISFAALHQSRMISLGEKRMRVETAGVYVCSVFNMMHH